MNYYDIDPVNREVFYNKIYDILFNCSRVYDLYQNKEIAKALRLKI